MFRRSNFTSACKNYIKYVDSLKTNLQAELSKNKISSDVGRRFEKIVDSVKASKTNDTLLKLTKLQAETSRNKLTSDVTQKFEKIVDSVKGCKTNDALVKLNKFKSDTKCRVNFERKSLRPEITKKIENVATTIRTIKAIQSVPEMYKQTLSVLQNKLDILSSKDIKTNSARNPALFTGASILGLNSSPITISGYSSYDLEILRQLGFVNNTNLNVQLDSPATNPITVENVEATNPETTINSTDFPPSLFDMQHGYPYQSIFDNMPPEDARNDIYTTVYNTFNRQRSSTEVQQQNSSEIFAEPTEIHDETVTGIVNNDVTNQHLIYTIDKDTTLTEMTNVGGGTDKMVTNVNESVASTTNINADGATNVNLDASDDGFGAFNVVTDNVKINSVTEPIVEAIPEPPPVPDVAAEIASQMNVLGEPTFASLGLGGWTPVGIVQNCFEYLHVTLGVPWWEAVAIGTLIIRFMLFPLVVIAQRNAAKMNNHLPQMQVIQLKMTEARQSGNQLEVARYSQELMSFMKEKNVNPFKNMIVPLAQMPVFVSFFVGLRQMANVPVDSLRTGGLFWFQDLTVPDQFFALPVITSLTLWATIELGTDSAKLSSQNLQTMKYVLRALPLVILPFTMNFPGVILCYWVSSNFISLAQVGFLKIPAVRDYFNIDPLLKHDPSKMPVQSKGFVGGIKESWTNLKITKELEERRRLDELQFQKAGKGPLVKTYKYDPTKQASAKGAISAKNR